MCGSRFLLNRNMRRQYKKSEKEVVQECDPSAIIQVRVEKKPKSDVKNEDEKLESNDKPIATKTVSNSKSTRTSVNLARPTTGTGLPTVSSKGKGRLSAVLRQSAPGNMTSNSQSP